MPADDTDIARRHGFSWRADRRSAVAECACRSRQRSHCTTPVRRAATRAPRHRSTARRCVAGMMCTCVIAGDSSMRATWKPSKLFCCARPFLNVISPYLAMLSPITAAPFDLRADALGVRGKTAIDRGIDARHGELALVVDRDLDDRRDIADKASDGRRCPDRGPDGNCRPQPACSATTSTTRRSRPVSIG